MHATSYKPVKWVLSKPYLKVKKFQSSFVLVKKWTLKGLSRTSCEFKALLPIESRTLLDKILQAPKSEKEQKTQERNHRGNISGGFFMQSIVTVKYI